MSHILIIGAGGVSRVATIKCAMNADTFTQITLASRTKSKCDEIAKFIKERLNVSINTAQINADDSKAVARLALPRFDTNGRLRRGENSLYRHGKLRAS